MTLETFFAKFDQFAEAPDAVARMRELVWELAVQGKLAEKRADDARDREWLDLAQQLDAAFEASAVGIEPPFEIPDWWRWTTLERLGDTKPRNDAPDSAESSFVPMTLIPAEYGQTARHEVRPWSEIKKGYTHFKNGDVVMAKITPCFENGKSGVMNGLTGGFGAGTTELHVFRRTGTCVLPEFAVIYLKTRGFITRGIPRMTGSAGQKRVPSDYFARSLFPLPPPAEQKRIVAKVDELMGLCDRLEAQQQEREARHAVLACAALARFADAPTPANLQLLFRPSYAISPPDLRRSILALAVKGRLVAQDPNDEAVEASVKAARQKAGLLPRAWDAQDEVETTFEVPESWRWVTVADVAEARLGKMLDKEKNRGEAHAYLRNTNVHWFRFELESIKTMLFGRSELEEYRVEPGDVLICEGGHGIARSAVWKGEIPGITFQKALHRVRPLSCLNGHFLTYCLWVYEREEILQKYYTGAGIPHFTGKALARVTFPLPPIAEQLRIVAKVDQLMALVDELEAQLAASRATAANLLTAVVAELTSPDKSV